VDAGHSARELRTAHVPDQARQAGDVDRGEDRVAAPGAERQTHRDGLLRDGPDTGSVVLAATQAQDHRLDGAVAHGLRPPDRGGAHARRPNAGVAGQSRGPPPEARPRGAAPLAPVQVEARTSTPLRDEVTYGADAVPATTCR